MDNDLPAPQEQAEHFQTRLLNEPAYLKRQLNKMADEYESAQHNWYKVESCLWLALFVSSILGFKAVPRMLGSEKVNQQTLKICLGLSGFFLHFVVLEVVYERLFPKKFFDLLCNFNAIITLVLPFVWFFLAWPEFRWLTFVFVASGFMTFIMLPHLRAIFKK